jgi:hypothetical protein
MDFFRKFWPKEDRFAVFMLYGMVFSTCFNGYDAGIMTVILADKQFIEYYNVDATRSGVIATIPWASTGTDPKISSHLGLKIQDLLNCVLLDHLLIQSVDYGLYEFQLQ